MHEKYFESLRNGVSVELDTLNVDGKLNYIRKIWCLVVPDERLAIIFINALLPFLDTSDLSVEQRERVQRKIVQLAMHLYALSPLGADAIALMQNINPQHEQDVRLKMLHSLALSSSEKLRLERMVGNAQEEDAIAYLQRIIEKNNASMGAAIFLLKLCTSFELNPEAYMHKFVCPRPLMDAWNTAVFQHYARLGQSEQSLRYWEKIPPKSQSYYGLGLAGDMYMLAGEKALGLRYYLDSLRLNPLQVPLHYRIRSITQPIVPLNVESVKKRTVICLYSWNKAELLEGTLRSLAASHIGNVPVYVLLNGCTDDSRVRVEALAPLFAASSLHIIELPINIGAPAARNWLLATEEVAQADYVAFIDDDVEVQPDWLGYYLALMERDPSVGAVGCKVVSPAGSSDNSRMQYIYRTVSLAIEGLLKLSIDHPLDARHEIFYSFTRETMNVMGCLHLLRGEALRKLGGFDIQFTPSQLDDIDHDLRLCLEGYKVMYCGEVKCVHHQKTGKLAKTISSVSNAGNVIGNDVKLTYKHAHNLGRLNEISDALDEASLKMSL